MSLVQLSEFVAGYLVILATPGPNTFAVAGIASVRGLRGALPFCLGLSLGAGALCAAMAMAAHAEFRADKLVHLVSAGLLGWVASGILRGRAREGERSRLRVWAAFGAGLTTAAANPLTAAYFLSNTLSDGQVAISRLTPILVALVACAFYLLVASALAAPAARRIALAWDRPIRLVATAILTSMAARMAWPLLAG